MKALQYKTKSGWMMMVRLTSEEALRIAAKDRDMYRELVEEITNGLSGDDE